LLLSFFFINYKLICAVASTKTIKLITLMME
jgi:hypothetical protein